MRHLLRSVLISALAVAMSAGCGSKSEDDGSGDAGPSGQAGHGPGDCSVVSASAFKNAKLAGWLEAEVVAEGASGTLRIELNERPGRALSAGSFDLSKAPDDDYSTCTHCVVMLRGGDDVDSAIEVAFQTSGTMVIDQVTSPPGKASKGSLQGVRLVEVKIDPETSASTPVSGGECYFLASASWDTTVAAGTPCESAEDCGDPSSAICEPVTRKCGAAQCDAQGLECAAGQMCLAQGDDTAIGACYPSCKPFAAAACVGDAECVVITFDQEKGICLPRGTAKEGEACNPSDVTTSCAQGLVCAAESAGNLCRLQCDFLAAQPSCPGMQVCTVGSSCSNAPVDPATPGAACDGAAPEATPCALDGQAARGVCVAETTDGGESMICRKVCRMGNGSDCGAGESCQDYFGTTGLCR